MKLPPWFVVPAVVLTPFFAGLGSAVLLGGTPALPEESERRAARRAYRDQIRSETFHGRAPVPQIEEEDDGPACHPDYGWDEREQACVREIHIATDCTEWEESAERHLLRIAVSNEDAEPEETVAVVDARDFCPQVPKR